MGELLVLKAGLDVDWPALTNNQNFRVCCLGQAEDVIEISSRQPILAKYQVDGPVQ